MPIRYLKNKKLAVTCLEIADRPSHLGFPEGTLTSVCVKKSNDIVCMLSVVCLVVVCLVNRSRGCYLWVEMSGEGRL
jgi:hypothetical protein